jgi:hypothetical protein
VLRYDPWVYTSMLDHPIVMTLIVGTATLLLAVEMTHHVQDPNRAVVFKEGRFHQLDPRGEILVWPGMDIGAEVSLAEQRVLGWPVFVHDGEGKEHTLIVALTWRIVPTGPRPGPREQRMLLMPNGDRRTIVVQTLERAMRDVARLCTPAQVRELAVDSRFLEALRDRVNADLTPDALVVDRLHVVRVMLTESKEEEPKPGRETRTVTPAPDGQGQLLGQGQADPRSPLALSPPSIPSPPRPAGGSPHLASPVAAAGVSRPLLTIADHIAILSAICERSTDVRQRLLHSGDRLGLAVLDAAMEALPATDALRVRIAVASFIARVVRQAYAQVPPAVATTVATLMLGLDHADPAAVASACQQRAEAYKKQGDVALSGALALASGIAADGATTIFNPTWQAARGQTDTAVAERLLRASIDGTLTGFLLGTMLSAAAAQSPLLAAALFPPPGALLPQDAAIARAIEQAAEEIIR